VRIALVLFVVFAACKGDDRGSPAAAAPPPSAPADRRPTLVFLGDSLTAGLGLSADEAVPARIAVRIEEAGLPFKVVNGGRSGDTSAGGLARLTWYLRPEVDMAALVVNLGSNDALRGLPLAELEKNLTAIIERAKAAVPGAPIFLVELETFPNLGAEFTGGYRAVFPRVAQATGAVLVPFPLREVMLDPALLQADGVHPNAAGAEKMAATMWPALEPLLRQSAAAHHQ
jgi:acyl-CoA thioesterase-1